MKGFVLLCTLVAVLLAQPFEERDPRAIIEKVRIYRLTQELELSTEQAIKFFPKLNDFEKIERDFNDEKIKIIDELRRQLRKEASDKEINETLKKFEGLHRQKIEDQIEKMKEMFELLTTRQKAKFIIFREDFNREIREMIKQVKQHHAPFEP